ncbi:MAG: HD domain-containing protein [Candidatus Latescibacteria bacterium]|nr:HD domain-containing protein [Candidatus Latescibacterota bacterium]
MDKNKFLFSIDPQTIRVETTPQFDVFIDGDSENSHIFIKAGDIFQTEQQTKIFSDDINLLYIRQNDKPRYYKYILTYLSDITEDVLLQTANKARVLHELITFLSMTIFSSPSAKLITEFRKVIQLLTEFVIREEDAIKDLIHLTTSSFHLYNHVVNVGIFGLGLAREIIADDSTCDMSEISSGLFLHDIGRFTIPKYFNQRNGPLSNDEWKVMKKHPEEGYKILDKFNTISEEIKVIVLQHHERNNGSGYPMSLRGNQIHMYSKICAISDTFDALTSYRPYRPAQSSFNALAIMQNEMKGEFEPEFFARFVRLFSKQ